MTPEIPSTMPGPRGDRPVPRVAARRGRWGAAAGPDAMARLTEVTAGRLGSKRRGDSSPAGRGDRRRRSVMGPAALAGLAVGGALLFAEPFQHLCGATFRISGADSDERTVFFRKELLAFSWEDLANHPEGGLPAARWVVDEPAKGLLRVSLATTDRARGVERARALAEGFLWHLEAMRRESRSTPTEGETILGEYVERLQSRLSDAQEQLEQAVLSIPDSDPRIQRETLLSHWKELRGDFAAARERLARTARDYEDLHRREESGAVSLSPSARREAFLADEALQQDLRELGVTLTELKLHLLNVWQRSSSSLEQLGPIGRSLVEQLARRAGEAPTAGARESLEQLMVEAQPYLDGIESFGRSWTAEFKSLQQREVDPESGDILDAHQRARTLLNDFLFSSGQRLSTMRSRVNELSRNPDDNARMHVLQSEVTRVFQELQAAHHRFEFAAGSIETPDNFRIDSALRIARGLRRRSTERMKAIEERLLREAAEQSRRQREEAMAALDAVIEKTRAASDRTIDRLLEVQEGLNQTSNLSEAFVSAVLRAELANHRLQATKEDLDRMESQLRILSTRRATSGEGPAIALAECGVVNSAINLGERLRVGGVGAGVAFAAVVMGQLLFRRRP